MLPELILPSKSVPLCTIPLRSPYLFHDKSEDVCHGLNHRFRPMEKGKMS